MIDETIIVDDIDRPLLESRSWRLKKRQRPDGSIAIMAVVSSDYTFGYYRTLYLHRLILGVNHPKLVVDHIDGNPLNNSRENLRVCTSRENSRNMGKRTGAKYRGVNYRKDRKTWRAVIKVDYKFIHLGTFDTAEEAAYAYDQAALRYFGEFARTNFPRR
jgi:hypothetical protein